jgi:hypothetical protein
MKMASKPTLTVQKLLPNSPNLKKDPIKAVIPFPVISRSSRTEDVVGEVTLFDTGIRFDIPPDHHVEITENPNLWKQGYSLVSPIIISPNDDQGSIQIPLLKRDEGDDLEINPDHPPIQFKLVKNADYFLATNNMAQTPTLRSNKKSRLQSQFL